MTIVGLEAPLSVYNGENSPFHFPIPLTTLLSNAERKLLVHLGKTKRTIVVIVRSKVTFFDGFPGLKENMPKDAALVAIVPGSSKAHIKPEVADLFDLIVFGGEVRMDTFSSNFEIRSNRLSALGIFASELAQLVPKEKISMFSADEALIMDVCRVKQQFGFEGVYMEDIAHLHRKELVAKIAEQAGVPTPKTIFIDFSVRQNKEETISKIMTTIPKFPMFAKPSWMCGSFGTARLDCEDDVAAWFDALSNDENPTSYVVQEYVEGREFQVLTILLQDGSWVPFGVKYMPNIGFYDALREGKPMVSIVEPFETANRGQFPNVYNFAKRVIEAFAPPHPHVFMIQGFQTRAGCDEYSLAEFDYRVSGVVANATMYDSCGVDQYTAMALTHLDPHYYPKRSPDWKPKIQSSIWYYNTKGVLRSHNDVPSKPEISGSVKATWYVQPGTELAHAVRTRDATVSFILESESEEERDRDAKWICDNWKPDMER